MPNKTSNFNLTKPLPEEFYNIQVHNDNMDIIDRELKNRATLNEEGKVPKDQLPNTTYVPVSSEVPTDSDIWIDPDDETVEDTHLTNTNNPHNVTAEQVGAAKIQKGSYVGTGTHGSNNPNTLTFDFEPKLIIITGESVGTQEKYYVDHALNLIRGESNHSEGSHGSSSTVVSGQISISWNGKTVSWYCSYSAGWSTGQETIDSVRPAYQRNESGKTYHYIVIG